MVVMHVLGLTKDISGDSPILVLRQADVPEGEEAQILPIWVGIAEAVNLSMALNRVRLRRPLPHDLLLASIRALGGRICGVRLTDLREGTFYAEADIAHGGTFTRLDCRPSDAVILALRADVDIHVAERVFAAAMEGRIRPDAPDRERRPLDSAEDILREAGQKLLDSVQVAETPDIPAETKTSFPGAVLGTSGRDGGLGEAADKDKLGSSTGTSPERGLGAGTGKSASPADAAVKRGARGDSGLLNDEELMELLRRIEPASRRMM